MAKQTIGIGSAANDGTGDTLRSAFDKANDNFTELYDASSNSSTLNVLTYGADNTGATDSLAAFDAAIAAASAGDRIYIPTGTFSLSNTWTISKQVTVFGPGTITEASVLTPVIEVTADKVQLHDFTVSGIETTGNWNTSAATIHARCGIHINDGDDCLISRVRIVTKSTGIKLTAANRTTIRDALWQGINLASQPASYAESAGLRTVSAIDVLVDGGSWTLGGRGMALEGVLTARVTIKSPTIYTCESDGIYINDPSGVQILGGWIQGVDGYGINIEDGDTLTVSNVYVRSNTSASMFLGTGTVSSLKLNQSDLASLTFSTGTYDDVDLTGSDIATLTTTSGGTLKGVKGTPKSLSTVTHGATAGAPALEFNVMAFGAAGDGATDDASAIQAAIDAAAAIGGGTVRVPARIFTLSSGDALTGALSLPTTAYSNVRIVGDPGATLKSTKNGNHDVIVIGRTTAPTGVLIQGIIFDNNYSGRTSVTSGVSVEIESGEAVVQGCRFINPAWRSISAVGGPELTVRDCRFQGPAGIGSAAPAIYCEGAPKLRIIGCHFSDWYSASGSFAHQALYLASFEALQVLNNYFENVETAIDIRADNPSTGAAKGRCKGAIVSGNLIRGGTTASPTAGGTEWAVRFADHTSGWTFSNNVIQDWQGQAMLSIDGEAAISGTDISFNGTTEVITKSGGSLMDAFSIGDVLEISGASDSGNNDTVTITAITDTTITVDGDLVDESAGATVTLTNKTRCGGVIVGNTFTYTNAGPKAPASITAIKVQAIDGGTIVGNYFRFDRHNGAIVSQILDVGTGNAFGWAFLNNRVEEATRVFVVDGSSATKPEIITGGNLFGIPGVSTDGDSATYIGVYVYTTGGSSLQSDASVIHVDHGLPSYFHPSYSDVEHGGALVQTPGDASYTVQLDGTVTGRAQHILYSTTLTADRTLTLSTTGAWPGAVIRVTRSAAGAFNLNVGTGPLKALAASQWCEVTYDGSAWFLSAYGSL